MSRLTTERTRLQVHPLDGEALQAEVFLRPDATQGTGSGTLGAELNAEGRKFVPLAVEQDVLLYRLSWIAYVHAEEELPELLELQEVGATRESVSLTLCNGDTLEGELVYVMPEQSHRVSDVLNSPGNQFLLLVNERGCSYVNREAIVSVKA